MRSMCASWNTRSQFGFLYFKVIIITSCVVLSVHSDWTVSAQLNPDCVGDCDQHSLIYVNAKNQSTSVHTFIDASLSSPSVLVVHSSDPDARPNFNWTTLFNSTTASESIQIPNVTQSYALTLFSLVDYNDTTDAADFSGVSDEQIHIYPMSPWKWHGIHQLQPNKSYSIGREIFEVTFVANGTDKLFSQSGSVQVRFMLSNSDRRNPLLPQLSFVPGLSLQVELALGGLVSQYNRGRFGLQLALLSNATLFNEEDYVLNSVFRIDDEVTPGNFETININLGKTVVNNTDSHVPEHNPEPPAFIQIRPISYTFRSHRDIKHSRNAKVAQFRNITTKVQRTNLRKTIPFYFYGNRFHQQFNSIRSRRVFFERFTDTVPSPIGIRMQNVSFGTTEDGFYKASGYIVWTLSFGLGYPPEDHMSNLLIGMISFSVCVILASLLFGSLVLLVVRRRRRRADSTSFAPLNESLETFHSATA